jgi:hypothetical protein
VDEAAQCAQSPQFPPVREAPLPVSYREACRAIEACARLDECRAWECKATALASYARQLHDDTLRDYAARLQARAARQCGRLLMELAGAKGGDRRSKGGHPPVDCRKAAAEDAGLSAHQLKQVIRVANVPEDEFVAALEASPPATVTALAARGRQGPVAPRAPRPLTPWEVLRRTYALLRQLAILCETQECVRTACASAGITPHMLRAHARALR